MKATSLFKLSFVASALFVVVGGTQPQQAFGSQTGTLPVIVGPGSSSLTRGTKDNGTLPVIIVPSNPTPHGDGSAGGFGDQTFTVTVTVNQPSTDDQVISLSSTHPHLVSVDPTVTVLAGSSTATATYTVPYSFAKHHHNVKLVASCNGSSVDCTVQVHYKNEEY